MNIFFLFFFCFFKSNLLNQLEQRNALLNLNTAALPLNTALPLDENLKMNYYKNLLLRTNGQGLEKSTYGVLLLYLSSVKRRIVTSKIKEGIAKTAAVMKKQTWTPTAEELASIQTVLSVIRKIVTQLNNTGANDFVFESLLFASEILSLYRGELATLNNIALNNTNLANALNWNNLNLNNLGFANDLLSMF